MKPHLVRWAKDFSDKGLVVIDVDNGRSDTQAALKADAEKSGLKFPLLWDKDGKNCETYAIRGFPAAFLIGTDGKVVWEGFPGAKFDEVEKLLKAELEKVKK